MWIDNTKGKVCDRKFQLWNLCAEAKPEAIPNWEQQHQK